MQRKIPLKFNSPALLVIDMQRYFLDKSCDAFMSDGPNIVPNICRLISSFRKMGRPVIFTRHANKKDADNGEMGRWWNGKLPWEGGRESELIDEMAPAHNEMVISKKTYSAFQNTNLKEYLSSNGISEVVICGVMTHLCVETTARHAFLLDLQPIVVSDACASESREHHNAALLNLGHGFAHIVTTEKATSLL